MNKFSGKERKSKFKFSQNKGAKGRVNSTGKCNDVAWYAQNPLLLKQAGIVNFLNPVGSELNLIQNGIDNNPPTWISPISSKRFPGVVALKWIPTPGVTNSPEAPVNKCASTFFTALRLKNFSTSVYDSSDVMFYFLACDSIMSFYAYLTLIYTYAKKQDFENLYRPRAVIEAMNVDYDDIISNLSQFVHYIDVVQNALIKLKVPKSIYFIARHLHMSAQVYKDTNSAKSQYYVFVPDGVFKYDATTPKLEYISVGSSSTKLKFSDLQTIMNNLMDAILPDDDMMCIAADVVKFLGSDVWTVNPIDWGTSQEPVYNQEMLWQIHNADILMYSSVDSLDITQAVTTNLNTILKWDPIFHSVEHGVGLKRIIDSKNESPSPEEIVESTRLKFTVKNFQINSNVDCQFNLGSCGSEILCNATITYFLDNSNLVTQPLTTFVMFNNISHTPAGTTTTQYLQVFPLAGNPTTYVGNDLMSADFRSIIQWGVFDYHPLIYVMLQRIVSDSGQTSFVQVIGSIDNYAVIEDEQLNALNYQSLLSELDLAHAII